MLGFQLRGGRLLPDLQVEIPRPSFQFHIGFMDRNVELAFVQHLAPSVARRTVVGHALTLLISSSLFIWYMRALDDTLQDNSGAYLTKYATVMSVSLGIQFIVLCALMFIACIKCASQVPWEILSIMTTALCGLLMPWQTPRHAFVLLGGHIDQLHACEGVVESEVLCIAASKLIVDGYTNYVPVRWRYKFFVPICFAISSTASAFISDSCFSISLPFKLFVLPLLHLSCCFGKRFHESSVRERWLASERVLVINRDGPDMRDVTAGCCDTVLQGSSKEVRQASLDNAAPLVPGALLRDSEVEQTNEPLSSDHDEFHDRHSDSEMCFTYTCSFTETQEMSFTEKLGTDVVSIGTQTTVEHDVQFLSQRNITKDVAVNTALVWREDAFSCSVCAKPPRLPGPPLSSQNIGRREMHGRGTQQHQRYKGNDFDGQWILCEEDFKVASMWLRRMLISGCHVVFADLTGAYIVQEASSTQCFVHKASIWLDVDGTLLRKGSSGRVVRYSRNCDGASSCSSVQQEY
eukprot:TRINITY_DN23200_c0_g1_i1.p1 TRINITY_DN23200_c0_g1~~TRINITY_DN23200_c0_g1_i1.p1  ORF type:complete len:520 (+),score=44.47 TRINITY_DN23200_c0_g1_i1:32-1591(+)